MKDGLCIYWRRKWTFACASALFLAIAGLSQGDLIIYGTRADYTPISGGSLSDVRLAVRLDVVGSTAVMTFTNVSVAPEYSVSFKLITIDQIDDDTGLAVLSNATILTSSTSVSYSLGSYSNLPGYTTEITDEASIVVLTANSSAPTSGINPGEILQVRFDTILSEGSDIYDYLGFFNGGNDTAAYTIAFHAISSDIIDGESLGGAYVPEPVTISLLLVCGISLLR